MGPTHSISLAMAWGLSAGFSLGRMYITLFAPPMVYPPIGNVVFEQISVSAFHWYPFDQHSSTQTVLAGGS